MVHCLRYVKVKKGGGYIRIGIISQCHYLTTGTNFYPTLCEVAQATFTGHSSQSSWPCSPGWGCRPQGTLGGVVGRVLHDDVDHVDQRIT